MAIGQIIYSNRLLSNKESMILERLQASFCFIPRVMLRPEKSVPNFIAYIETGSPPPSMGRCVSGIRALGSLLCL
jgi:hypothetical protein